MIANSDINEKAGPFLALPFRLVAHFDNHSPYILLVLWISRHEHLRNDPTFLLCFHDRLVPVGISLFPFDGNFHLGDRPTLTHHLVF